MEVDGRRELSAEALGVLKEGIGMVFSRWWFLQVAVEEEMAGPDTRRKIDQLASNVISWFTRPIEQLYIDDLKDMFTKTFDSFIVEEVDGCIQQDIDEVAGKLMSMHKECLEGNFKSVESLKKVPIPDVRQVMEDDDDDDDDDYNDTDKDDNDSGDEATENADSSNMMLDDSSNMMLDAPELRSNSSLVDMSVTNPSTKVVSEPADGWVQVTHRRNRGKRN